MAITYTSRPITYNSTLLLVRGCQELADSPHRMVSSQQRSAGTVVKVVCSPGYVFTDGATEMATVCLPDGVWRPLLDNCSGKAFLIFHFLLWGKLLHFIGFSGRLSYNPRPLFQIIDTRIASYRITDLGLGLYCNKRIRTSQFPKMFCIVFQ